MKVVVLGAGIIGVTSAWYLTKAGHEVTVIDRQPAVAQETSFANAGGVCPSFAGPWAAPGMPLKVAKWMFQSSPPLRFSPKMDIAQWTWLSAFLTNCNSHRFQINKTRMQRIAHYSLARLIELRAETGLRYDHQSAGVLQVFQTDDEVKNSALAASVLERTGIKHRIVDTAEVKVIEPALAQSKIEIAGGLFLPEDETGDCHLFCKELVGILEKLGVSFQFNTHVIGIQTDNDLVTRISTSNGDFKAEAYVVALGAEVATMMHPLDIRLPIYPIKGYSITGKVLSNSVAPRSSVMDENSKVMVTRLGNRLRAAGMAEVAGFDKKISKSAIDSIITSTSTLFPGAVDYDKCEVWTGFRPMTPDGPPRLGKTQYDNLFLNAGHGSNGWTQACGAAKIIADIVSGTAPDIDISGLTYMN